MSKKKTKWEVFSELEDEFYKALPEVANRLDVSISEAQCDKCDNKDYEHFRKVIYSEFKD